MRTDERTSPKILARSRAAQQGRRSGRLHRQRLRAAHPVLGRGSAARGPARSARGSSTRSRPSRGWPTRARRSATRSTTRSRPSRSTRSSRPGMRVTIAVDDISLPLPPMTTPDIRQTIIEILLELLDANGVDDVHIVIANSLHRRLTARRDEADGGREDPRRLLPGPLLQPRRRGSRRHRPPRQDRPRRDGEHQPPLRRERPRHLREHQPRAHGRRPQVGGGRPVRLREPPPAPRARDHPRVGQLHGPEAVDAEHEGRAPGGARRPAHERVPHRDRAQQPHLRRPDRVPVQERGRVHRDRSAQVRGHALDAVEDAARREAQAVPRDPGPVPDDRLLRRQDRAGAREDPQALLGPVRRPHPRPGRHPHLPGAVHLALQRELDPEPAARAGDGARLLPQLLSAASRCSRRAG